MNSTPPNTAENTAENRDLGTRLDQGPQWRSVGLSLLFHVLFLVLLAFLFTATPGGDGNEAPRRVSVVLAEVSDSPSLFEYEDQTDVTKSSQAAPNEPIEAIPEDRPANLPDVQRPDLPGFEFTPDGDFDASKMVVVPQNSNPSEKYELSPEDLKFITDEQSLVRDRAPKGQPVETRIFGSGPLSGRKFVFVIDRSQSMGESGLGVLDRAKDEIGSALEVLQPEHSFQVIAYHRSTLSIGERKLLSATDLNKQRVPVFIQGIAAFGATSHQNGLTAALAFQPDIVVFMTDGGLPALNEGEMRTVAQMAGNRTQIHCLQFGQGPLQEDDNFMMRIATQSSGSYRYIDVMEWNKK